MIKPWQSLDRLSLFTIKPYIKLWEKHLKAWEKPWETQRKASQSPMYNVQSPMVACFWFAYLPYKTACLFNSFSCNSPKIYRGSKLIVGSSPNIYISLTFRWNKNHLPIVTIDLQCHTFVFPHCLWYFSIMAASFANFISV